MRDGTNIKKLNLWGRRGGGEVKKENIRAREN